MTRSQGITAISARGEPAGRRRPGPARAAPGAVDQTLYLFTKRWMRLQIRTNNSSSAALPAVRTATGAVASDAEPSGSVKTDKINQSQGVLIGRISNCTQNDQKRSQKNHKKCSETTKKKPTHLIPEQPTGAFRYVRLLSLKPQTIIHTSRPFRPNPVLWIYRKNAIKNAGEHRQRNYKTGAWVSFPNSRFRAEKMMLEL